MDFYRDIDGHRPTTRFNLRRYEVLAEHIARDLKLSSLSISRSLLQLQGNGFALRSLSQTIFAPRATPLDRLPLLPNALAIRKRLIGPSLRLMRGEYTLAKTSSLLGLNSVSAYHHWESGRRDLQLAQWLQIVDLLSGRLAALLEVLEVEVSLESFGFKDVKPGLYAQFFSDPWTPTLLISLRLPELARLESTYKQAKFLSEHLNIAIENIENSFDKLMRLKLVRIENGRFTANPEQFYAIPSNPSSKNIEGIHEFWFARARQLLSQNGYHRVEQHALTHESKERIIQWVTELREKIRKEVKNCGEPETLIHINWQIAELI